MRITRRRDVSDSLSDNIDIMAAFVMESAGAEGNRVVAPAISTAGRAIRKLALYGRLKIISDSGGTIIAEWIHNGMGK